MELEQALAQPPSRPAEKSAPQEDLERPQRSKKRPSPEGQEPLKDQPLDPEGSGDPLPPQLKLENPQGILQLPSPPQF